MANEQRILAADYITQFYRDIQEMTTALAMYINTQKEITIKYGLNIKEAKEKLSDGERAQYFQAQQTFTGYVIRTKLQLAALQRTKKINDIDKTISEGITISYNKIIAESIVMQETATEYVELMACILINATMQDLLMNSQKALDEIYAQR
jgi:hypothetical protein